MFLRKLTLLNFKNHQEQKIEFSAKINCLIGNNGVGKTNLLDSVYYLCLTKSYFNSVDQQNIRFKENFFRLEGLFENGQETYSLVYKLASGKKKELAINDVAVSKMSDHIGHFPAVIISPDDSQLVMGNSEERRRFLDNTISQINRQYLQWVIDYNKILAQRNSALKQFAESSTFNRDLIESYNHKLIPLGNAIHQARRSALHQLTEDFHSYYRKICLEREQVSLTYVSQLTEKSFADLLRENIQRDAFLQRTETGIHKDDIDFFIGDNKLKKFGSQGQQKSFIIAIKLAQHHFIRQAKGFAPLLLIDDVFDKLDSDRSHQLVELISGDNFGQVFLTDTDDAPIRKALEGKSDLYEVFKL